MAKSASELSNLGPAGRATADGGLVTLDQAAEILGVHYMTAYRYVRSGKLAARQQAGRWIVDRGDVEDFSSTASGTTRNRSHDRRSRQAVTNPARSSNPHQLADMLEHGDENAAWSAVEPFAVASATSRENWVELLASSMRIIGERWEAGDTSVAEEHRASVVALRLIGRLGARGSRPGRKKGSVVLAAAPGDLHGLPTALAAEVLRVEQYSVVDLGADVPVDETWKLAATTDCLLAVGFCATNDLTRTGAARLARAVKLVQDEIRVPVIVGGAGVGDRRLFEKLGADVWTRSLPELLTQMELIHSDSRAN